MRTDQVYQQRVVVARILCAWMFTKTVRKVAFCFERCNIHKY